MRILVVCSNFRVFGAETVTLKLLEGLKSGGHHLVAVTSPHTDGEFGRRLSSLGIREEVMPFGAITKRLSPRYIRWTLYTLVRLPFLWWRWHRLFRTFRPDVVLWTSPRQALLLYPLLGWIPMFVIQHENVVQSTTNRWLYGSLSRKITGFVAVSDFVRSRLRNIGVPVKNINVIKNGTLSSRVMPDIETATPNRKSETAHPTRIGIVGRLSPNKGLDSLVEATRLMAARGTSFTIHAYGDGAATYVNRLKTKLAEAGLAGVWKWMGYQLDQRNIYGVMDICVMPSCCDEAFGLAVLEASSFGLPVVASRRGGLPELIEDGVTGWLVESNAPAQLAEKLEWLICNPVRAHEMGAEGRQRVFKRFTVEKMVSDFEALFQRSLSVR